jgi:hypothetical protein
VNGRKDKTQIGVDSEGMVGGKNEDVEVGKTK